MRGAARTLYAMVAVSLRWIAKGPLALARGIIGLAGKFEDRT